MYEPYSVVLKGHLEASKSCVAGHVLQLRGVLDSTGDPLIPSLTRRGVYPEAQWGTHREHAQIYAAGDVVLKGLLEASKGCVAAAGRAGQHREVC